jgi:hypothetical protein
MLQIFGFEKIGVVFGDLYFHPAHGPEDEHGAEHGVRLEVRILEKGPAEGSESGSRRITAAEPIWRVDLLETVTGPPGSFDRTHHHPDMHNWNGGMRTDVPELQTDPVGWIGKALSDLDWLLAESDFGPEDVDPDDARQLREAVPEICDALANLLKRVHAGELGLAPAVEDATQLTRTGWM